MSSPVIVRVSYRYNHPAEKVFDAWITPNLAGRFLFATRTGNILRCEIDPHVGGGFTVTDRRPDAEGDESVFDAEHRGEYVELQRPSRLVFDFSVPPYSEEPTRVAIDIRAMGPACELVLTHDMGEGDLALEYEPQTRKGWTTMLANLDKVLSTRRMGL